MTSLRFLFRVDPAWKIEKKHWLTYSHDDVRLEHELALRRSVHVGDVARVGAVDERRAPDMVPHLARSHCEYEELRIENATSLVDAAVFSVGPALTRAITAHMDLL